jgi:hypothetical protein
MPLHLTKVAFGCNSLALLEARLSSGVAEVRLTTRNRPKRASEVVGGSLYWIIGHRLVARSPVLGFEDAEAGRTNIIIAACCIPVVPRPRRAHQGWRYLEPMDAPGDLSDSGAADADLPEELRRDLALLGLL